MIIDSFAGGGGASTGIEAALGRAPDVAINHNAAALALHAANRPETLHIDSNIWNVIAEAERRFHSTRDRFYNDVTERMRNAEGFRAREQRQ